MPALILPCANCNTSTVHRSPTSAPNANGKQNETIQCEACGTSRSIPADISTESAESAVDATKLMALLPALSQKKAHSKLEELLYEHRAGIEESDAFADAIAAANAADCEMQDVKVQKYNAEQAAVVVDFTYYALGERDDEEMQRRFRIDGTGTGRIDGQGNLEIQNVTAAVSDV